MQRKFSEPNTYIDGLPRQDRQEMLYDDVEMSELTAVVRTQAGQRPGLSRPPRRRTLMPEIGRLSLRRADSKSPAGSRNLAQGGCLVCGTPGVGTCLAQIAGEPRRAV